MGECVVDEEDKVMDRCTGEEGLVMSLDIKVSYSQELISYGA